MAAIEDLLTSLQNLAGRKLSCLSRSAFIVWAAAFGFIAVLVGSWLHTRSTIEHGLREQVSALAQAAADRASMTFDGVGRTLQSIGDGLQAGDLDPVHAPSAERRQALQATLAHARERNVSIVSIMLLDAGGKVIAVSPNDAYAYTTSDLRGEFPDAQGQDPHAPLISNAFRDPVTGIWKFRMAQRIGGSRGGGILVASIALDDSVLRFFDRGALNAGDVIALQDAAENPLAVYPVGAPVLPRSADKTGSDAAAGTESYFRSPTDGASHLVFSRRLARYPFFVVLGKNVDEWLVRWRQEQFLLVLAAIAAIVVTTSVATGIQRRYVLTEQLEKVRGDLEQTNDALRAALSGAEQLAARDQLTGLWNRRNFDHRLEGAIAHATRHGDTFSLLMIDIDHFKNVNDYFGHLVGDSVLKRFSEVLTERLRQNDVAARWGGEEFVILADGASLENSRVMAEQVRDSIATTTFAPVARVTVSIGIAEYQGGESGDDLLKRADRALYAAKRNGRNRVMAAEGHLPQMRQSAA
ncbi:MAG TPA: diguanylate cyclase [Rhodocyclaceae bacterium]|nr:diguanylate cyclase [Rhodocyclaceae bacterium]